jgi:hypothetical protein
MARAVPFNHPIPQPATAPLTRAGHVIPRVTALGAVLYVLSLLGSVLVRAVAALQQTGVDWAENRRRREEDRKLWELALTDSRVMADLVALSQQVPGGAGGILRK